jgi:hypothetical protein
LFGRWWTHPSATEGTKGRESGARGGTSRLNFSVANFKQTAISVEHIEKAGDSAFISCEGGRAGLPQRGISFREELRASPLFDHGRKCILDLFRGSQDREPIAGQRLGVAAWCSGDLGIDPTKVEALAYAWTTARFLKSRREWNGLNGWSPISAIRSRISPSTWTTSKRLRSRDIA